MRISSSDPLAARATSAAKRPVTRALAEDHEADLEADELELELEPWPSPAPVINEAFTPLAFTLPWPPSVNTLVRARAMQVHGRWMAQVYKTAEHRKYLEAVGLVVGDLVPTSALLAVSVKLYRPRRVGDIDGPIKALFDSLNGRAWTDDSQVVELHVTRHDDKHAPRVEVSITAAQPQE